MLNIIVAMADKNRVIGKEGGIPWYIPEDMRRFKSITMGDIVVTGRNTWDSLPLKAKPLPGRLNHVVTSDPDGALERFKAEKILDDSVVGSQLIFSKRANFRFAANPPRPYDREDCLVWAIGGERIYQEALGYAKHIYVTRVYGNFDGDAFMPEFEDRFKLADAYPVSETEDGIKWRFERWDAR